MVNSLDPDISSMASLALEIRLRKTCSNWFESPRTFGRSSRESPHKGDIVVEELLPGDYQGILYWVGLHLFP